MNIIMIMMKIIISMIQVAKETIFPLFFIIIIIIIIIIICIIIFYRARNQTQALSFIIKSCFSQNKKKHKKTKQTNKQKKKRGDTIHVLYSESNEAIHHDSISIMSDDMK